LEQSRAARLRRVQVAQEVARRRCWVVRDEEGVPRVERVHGGDSTTALTAAELDRKLAAVQLAGAADPAWDPAASAELERECAAAGVEIGFGQWWDLVTEGRWCRPQSVQHVQHATGHHSSYGAGGHSTFGAGF
ncbi:MAG: hypothetical protein L0H84_09820, partial [Pseudonocardia sp.]|nr:hypothetical protein [Pseudonocardia sp.]